MNLPDFTAFGVTAANVAIVYFFIRFLSNHMSRVVESLAKVADRLEKVEDSIDLLRAEMRGRRSE